MSLITTCERLHLFLDLFSPDKNINAEGVQRTKMIVKGLEILTFVELKKKILVGIVLLNDGGVAKFGIALILTDLILRIIDSLSSLRKSSQICCVPLRCFAVLYFKSSSCCS